MTKIKTHKGIAKRFKITWTGKYIHDKARKNHLMTNKKRADKANRYGKSVFEWEAHNVKYLLPYGK